MEQPQDLSADDSAAVLALVARYTRLFDANKADQLLVKEAQARIAENSAAIAQLKAVFKMFGFDIAEGGFLRIRKAVGDDAYRRALINGGRLSPTIPPSVQEDVAASAPLTSEAEGSEMAGDQQKAETPDERPTIRELVLGQLKAAGQNGAKAVDIRKFIQSSYAMNLHEKTVGMTLYRLSQDGLAERRGGRTWFLVQKPEQGNPGAGTPGHENAQT